ncbi:MAG: M91 family zinc metallopeptidase, partial [Cyclobacteriaceae bacterium]
DDFDNTLSNSVDFGVMFLQAFGIPLTGEGAINPALFGGEAAIATESDDGSSGGAYAYLNYIFYDKNFEDDAIGGFKRTSTAGANAFEKLTLDFIPEKEGYLYVYVSNEEPVARDIYFDDLKIVHKQSIIAQTDSYYPFGLSQGNMSMVREGRTKNQFLYNGKELVEGFDLGWYDYGARYYAADLGRFFNIDRFAEKYYDLPPYQYGANSAINYIDINGDSLWIQINKNNKALYVDGQLYNNDGSQYTGKGTKVDKNGNRQLTGFLKTAVGNLDQISGGKEGNKLVDEIQASTDNVTIVKGSAGSGNSYNTKTNEVTFDVTSQNGGLDTRGLTDRPTFVGLAHELYHSVDDIRGTVSGKKVGTTIQAEIFASHGENLIRAENFLPLRAQYNSGTPILDYSGNSIYYGNDYYNDVKLKPKPSRDLVPASTLPSINIRTQKK